MTCAFLKRGRRRRSWQKSTELRGFATGITGSLEKKLLEKPFTDVLQSGEPDFPFCLAWGNATWSGIWHGCPDRTLIKQEYPGIDDHRAHFESLIDAFSDDRYMKVDGKPVFVVFHPVGFPDPRGFTDTWRNLAKEYGFKGLYLVGIAGHSWDPQEFGYDAVCIDYFSTARQRINEQSTEVLKYQAIPQEAELPEIYHYEEIINNSFHTDRYKFHEHPCVIPNWDNTPRSRELGVVFDKSTPELFRKHLLDAIDLVKSQEKESKLVFLKSWNEWAEGNYLEPDQEFGDDYLKVIRDVVEGEM